MKTFLVFIGLKISEMIVLFGGTYLIALHTPNPYRYLPQWLNIIIFSICVLCVAWWIISIVIPQNWKWARRLTK